MSVLKQKLDKATEQFQTHNFKDSLDLYEDCLAFCYRTDESKGVIFNIMSTKGALHCILGQFQQALSTLNEVLRSDPNHYLALMRRSQVYKKKGKFNRALKDIEVIASYCPDNLQLIAMKIEIENLKSKNKNCNSSQQSESDEQAEEELQLNFSNLKKIDRKSCSIVADSAKRKSRVTISGDTAVVYESQQEQGCDRSQISTSISKEQAKEKYQKTFRQIQMDDNNASLEKVTNIVVKTGGRSKSILKNRNTNSLIQAEQLDKKDKYGGRDSNFVQKIKNIDGKVISSNHSLDIGSQKGIKEVQFKKSIFASQQKDSVGVAFSQKPKQNKKMGGRKSCLKRSSFQSLEKQMKQKPVRKSKFETMSRNSIDGVVIRNRKSLEINEMKEKQGNQKDDNQSDAGSSYNIFGSGQQLMISKEVSDQLGLSKGNDKIKEKEKQKQKKGRANGGKSILKKGSLLGSKQLLPQKIQKKENVEEPKEAAKKSKKSVMFTKSRFAE